jgi:hypothetical protein
MLDTNQINLQYSLLPISNVFKFSDLSSIFLTSFTFCPSVINELSDPKTLAQSPIQALDGGAELSRNRRPIYTQNCTCTLSVHYIIVLHYQPPFNDLIDDFTKSDFKSFWDDFEIFKSH